MRFSQAIFLTIFFLASCAQSQKEIKLSIYSEPTGATIIESGRIMGQAPLILYYEANAEEIKFEQMRINALTAKWASGATVTNDPEWLNTSSSAYELTLRRPAHAAGLDIDLQYAEKVNATERERAEAEAERQLRADLARASRYQGSQNQIAMGLEMMRTGQLPNAGLSRQKSNPPVYNGAITVGATDICPLSPNLGRYSHSTRRGMNKICYYK